MRKRIVGTSLVEVMIVAGMSLLIMGVAIASSFAIAKFSQHALLARTIDQQTSQGTDALTKELRDGILVLPNATVAGKSYKTSATCVVFSAVGYDFSRVNPILATSDTVVFAHSHSPSRITRTCDVGVGSKRPRSIDTSVSPCTSAQFIYRVTESVDRLNTSTSNVSVVYKLATIPKEQPSCTRNGIAVPCLWQSGSQSVTIQTPPGASIFGIQYQVTPSSTTCQYVTSVEIQVRQTSPSISGPDTTIRHTTEARLRNKR
jgi:hypothetical protein